MKKGEQSTRKTPRTSAAQIRVQKGALCSTNPYIICFISDPCLDLTELDLPPTMQTHFPDSNDILNFTLTIKPDEGNCLNFIIINWLTFATWYRHV